MKTHSPETETTTPKKTRKIAGSFSRLNKELGSSFIKIKPGKMYERGIAVSKPFEKGKIKRNLILALIQRVVKLF